MATRAYTESIAGHLEKVIELNTDIYIRMREITAIQGEANLTDEDRNEISVRLDKMAELAGTLQNESGQLLRSVRIASKEFAQSE